MYRKTMIVFFLIFSFISIAANGSIADDSMLTFTDRLMADTVLTDGYNVVWSVTSDNMVSGSDQETAGSIDLVNEVKWGLVNYKDSDQEWNLTEPIITDVAAAQSGSGLWIAGLVMDNRMDETYYENSAKLVGTPYVFIFRYDPIGSDGKRIYYLIRMYDHFGFPYNTDLIVDGDDIKQESVTYHWEDYIVHPKLNQGTGYDDQMWLICESALENPPPNHVVNKLGMNYMTVYQFNHNNAMFELYIQPWIFERSARLTYMPFRYRSDYRFASDLVFIQQNEASGYIEVINMNDENTGIAYLFDLSRHGKPRYITTYWK